MRVAIWCLLAWLSCGDPALAKDQPNIIFILTDDQGFADVSWHNDEVLTPNLQHLHDGGVRLVNNYVLHLCTPTRSALLTGYYPYHLGRQRSVLWVTTPTGLTLSKTLLPEELHDLGYRTHAIGKWHLGFCDWAYTPTYRGFDTFYGYYQAMGDYYTHDVEEGYDFRENERVAFEANNTYSTYLFGDRAVKVIEEEAATSEPFFLYLALQSVHRPHQVPDEYLDNYPVGDDQVYYGMMTAMDDVIGRVVEALHSTQQMNNTLIVFSSDNGSPDATKNMPLRGRKFTLWEGGTRVPGLVYGSMLHNTPREYSGLLHVTDWHNTLLAAAGADTLPDNDGFNQWEALSTGQTSPPRDSFIYNLDVVLGKPIGAIRVGKYKLYLGGITTEGRVDWLSDLEEDPGESLNLLDVKPDVAAELKELLLAQLESLVPYDLPFRDNAGNAENFGGVWEPGWCTATTLEEDTHSTVPNE